MSLFQQLEMCYNNGYRDAETVNSLRLLDSYKNFVTYKENGTILRLGKSEADLLHPYFEAELQRDHRHLRQEIQDEALRPGPG